MSDLFDFSSYTAGLPRYDTGSAASAATKATKPPVGWLFAATAIALAAGTTAFLFGEILLDGYVPVVAFACWALAGPGVIGLLACYEVHDTRRRTWAYSSPVWTPVLYRAVIVLMGGATGIAAWRIAEWAGRL